MSPTMRTALVALAALLLPGVALAQFRPLQLQQEGDRIVLQEAVTWHDEAGAHTAWIHPGQVAVQGTTPAASPDVRAVHPSAAVVHRAGGMTVWSLNATGPAPVQQLRDRFNGATFVPVLYDSEAATGMRVPTGRVLVRFADGRGAAGAAAWGQARGLRLVRMTPTAQALAVFEGPAGLGALATAERLRGAGEVAMATPDWWQPFDLR